MTETFVPDISWVGGFVTLKGLTLFFMTFFGAFVAIPVAWILKKTLFRGETPPFVMELPSYKWPSAWIVLRRVYDSAASFIVRAGTLIFAMSILIWAAGYFPGDHTDADRLEAQVEELQKQPEPPADKLATLSEKQNALNAALLEASFLGRMGHAIEPIVRPLGWDWKIGVGVIASFPAREVIIATLGTIYSLGGDVEDEEGNRDLQQTLKNSKWPDGRPVFTLPVAFSIMVFFALCAQCASTLMVIKRETNSWGWALFTFVYMTGLAYVAALLVYQIGSRWA